MTSSRARGRPRSQARRDVVLKAAMELMLEDDVLEVLLAIVAEHGRPLTSLSPSAARKSSVSSALTLATRPALRMMLGMPSRTSLPTKSLPS